MPDTATLPDSRYVPAEVRREIRRRSGGWCSVSTCDCRIFLQGVHDEPHWKGGSREAGNLDPMCGMHHTLLDLGYLRRVPGQNPPVFRTLAGELVGLPRE